MTNTLPDVVRSDITWVPTFAQGHVFAQLDGAMPNFAKIAKNRSTQAHCQLTTTQAITTVFHSILILELCLRIQMLLQKQE